MVTRALVALVVLVALTATGVQADEFGTRVPGQRVYDRAGVLSAAQIQTLERKASALDALGAPTVIFIQIKAATLEQAQQDARNLMDTWDVQSSAGAHDGFVMLFDLTPGNTQHGQVGLFAGARHASAALPAATLNAISGTVMRPALARGDLAGGISLGLDATAGDLRSPAPPATESTPVRPDRGPFDLLIDPLGWLTDQVSWFTDPFRWFTDPFRAFWVLFFAVVSVRVVRRMVRGAGGRRSGRSSWSSGSSSYYGGGSSGGDSGSASSGGDSGGSSF